jgi:hypothetical protein
VGKGVRAGATTSRKPTDKSGVGAGATSSRNLTAKPGVTTAATIGRRLGMLKVNDDDAANLSLLCLVGVVLCFLLLFCGSSCRRWDHSVVTRKSKHGRN